jgi:triacylglycerol lipase
MFLLLITASIITILAKQLIYKLNISIFIVMISLTTWGQLTPGFDKHEAVDMIAICNSYTFIDLYQDDTPIIPTGYKKVFTSKVMGLDNQYQIYTKGNVGVINLRGSTNKISSWLENCYSVMIPSKGVIEISGVSHKYNYGEGIKTAVHGGYALAITYLAAGIIDQIEILNKNNINNIIITGHSQGGALAQLLRAYLEHEPKTTINTFKTYAFAAPMVGNHYFSTYYNSTIAAGTSFNITNPADLIPTLPLTYNDSTLFKKEDITTLLFDPKSFDVKSMLIGGAVQLLEKPIKAVVKVSGDIVAKPVSWNLRDVKMPPYTDDINYSRLNEMITIPPADYPKSLKNPSILKNDSLIALYTKDEDGYFTNDDLYNKEPAFFQHKPYNYYATMMKIYFSDSYKKMELKYLPENLGNH